MNDSSTITTPLSRTEDNITIKIIEIGLTCVIAIIVILSNFLVIMQYCLLKSFRKTNASLFIFLLACFDFLHGLISMPATVVFYFEDKLLTETGDSCVFRILTQEFPNYCAMNWLLLMAICRSVAISFPFCHHSHFGRKTIWLVIFSHVFYHTVYVASFFALYEHEPGKICPVFRKTPGSGGMPKWWTDFVFIGMKVNLGLSVVLCVQSLVLVARSKKRSHSNPSSQTHSQRQSRSHSNGRISSILTISHLRLSQTFKKAKQVKTTTYLLFLYIILYTPKTLADIPSFRRMAQSDETGYQVYNLIRRVLVHANACVNMFVYAAAHKSNRAAYWWLLTHPPWRWGQMEADLV